MDLKQHKQLVFAYEAKLLELAAVREAVKTKAALMATCEVATVGSRYVVEIPLPQEYAERLLQEHVWQVEREAKDMASLLGVTFDPGA